MAPRNKLHSIISPALLLLIILFSIPSAKAQGETDDEKEFSYEECAKNGPERWGTIKKEWATCGYGMMQSPIDISFPNVCPMPELRRLDRHYHPQNASLVNRGHDIMLRFEGDAGSLWLNDTEYKLKQMHWHSPSEHAIHGERFNMELHMVHESAAKKYAVVGVLYTCDGPDELLLRLEPHLENLSKIAGTEEKVGVVDPRGILPGWESYYRYVGSLTTPPCTEGVSWTIMEEVKTVSIYQLQLLRKAVRDGERKNARPLQDVNGRMIGKYVHFPSESQGAYKI